MALNLKPISEMNNGYYEVAVVNLVGTPRILDFWSPPRSRKDESKELCKQFIKRMEEEVPKIIKEIVGKPKRTVVDTRITEKSAMRKAYG